MNAQPRHTSANRWRSALLLLGAYSFAYCLLTAVHELGHYLALRAYGITAVRIVLHPFTGCWTLWDATDVGLGVVDAAGPLNALLVGTLLTAVFWPWRRPAFLPFLLCAPVAYLTEGLSNFMQVAFHMPGSDAVRIVAAGVPESVLLALTLLVFLGGLVGLLLLLPLLNLSPEDSFGTKAVILAVGLGGFMFLGLLYGVLVDSQAIGRNAPHLLFTLIMAGLLAALYRPLAPWLARNTVTPVTWPASQAAVGLAGVIVSVQLLFFN